MEKLLIFHHVKHESARRYTDLADDLGLQYDIVEFWNELKKPDLSKYSRLLVMGGPQSVYDDEKSYPSRDFEIDAIKDFTKRKKPVLGCCLGSQLIAAAFNGKVYKNIMNGEPFKETGFFEARLTEKGSKDGIFKNFPESFDVFQWHGDVFDLPEQSELLATGKFVMNQAFKIKNTHTYSMLFHFDFLPEMVEELIKLDNKWLHTVNEANEQEMIAKAYELEPKIKELSARLFKNWLHLK